MQNILDIIDNYIIILDLNCNIKYCNKKILSKLKYTITEIANINIENLSINIEEIKLQGSQNQIINVHSKKHHKYTLYSEVILSEYNGEESIYLVAKDFCEKSYKREELERIIETLPINCWLKNMNGDYVYVNEAYAKDLGDDRLNILGKNTKEYWNEEMYNKFTSMDKEVIESKKFQLTEEYSKQGESELWVEIYKAPILDENGDVEYILGYTKDITLQKKLELEMHTTNEEINNLNNILRKTNSKSSINDLLKNVCENIQDYFECDGVSIALIDEEKNRLNEVMSCGIISEYEVDGRLQYIVYENLKYLLEAKKLNNILKLNDIKSEELKDVIGKNNIENIGVYNISFNDEIIGFLILKFLKNNTLKFNKFDYLKTISSNIGTMIKSHTLSKDVQAELEKRRQIECELELFLDISVDLIATGNLNGDINYINNNCTKTLGWSKEELLSMQVQDIIHPDFKQEYNDIMKDATNNRGCVTNKLFCKDGSCKWIEVNYKILREENKYIFTAKDISEQRKQEEERKTLEEAIHMESLKNEFFANISHEFRTPLNIILGTMQLMQRNVDNGKITWYESLNLESHINYIRQNSYRLLRLVNNLIDITSIESGYYQLQLGNHNIVDIVENITLSVAEYTSEQGINLIFDTNCEEQIIACDPEKIERVVLNLLSNAIKYTETDGCIYVDLHIDNDRVKVSIKDNGVGISKDKQDVIFDRFRKLDNSLNRKCEGSGIGLSLVKSLIELQDGNIYVESEVGKGSIFTFELPVRIIDDRLGTKYNREISKSTQIEKCNIEFSDIYS